MAKKIKPHKLIITYADDGSVKESVLLYRLEVDGATDARKFYTMGVDAGLDTKAISDVLTAAKTHTEKGEGINEKAV